MTRSNVTLMQGDCLERMGEIEPGSVDAVVTDPPYGMRWDTDGSRFRAPGKGGRNWGKPIEGDEKPFDPSPWICFPQVILWGANHFAASLPVGTTLVWVKQVERAYGSFLSDAEIGWQKGGCGVYLHKNLEMKSLARTRLHPNQKPVGLMHWCISRLGLEPGSTILDPYMGSGSTGVAAVERGFNFIGIEKDPEYFRVASSRIAAAERSQAEMLNFG